MFNPKVYLKYFYNTAKTALGKGYYSAKALFMFMIPIMIGIKILQEFNALEYLVYPFIPLMKFLGLPGVYSLAWLGSILNTNYTAFYLILLLFPDNPITYEQITVLALCCLICHALIMEGVVAHKFKIKGWWSVCVRFVSALIVGYVVHIVLSHFGIMQDTVKNFILSKEHKPTPILLDYLRNGTFLTNAHTYFINIIMWFVEQIKLLLGVYLIISTMFFLVQILKDINIFSKIEKFISPFFRIVGISKKNSFITLVSVIIGLSYGWALLRAEMDTNIYFRKDQAVKVVTFLSIIHAIIEDTLVFAVLGANVWILLIVRAIYALIFGYLLGKFILPNLPYKIKQKYLYN